MENVRHGLIHTRRIINRFGNAWLIRSESGKHELVGGSDDDYTAAKEWVSIFAHDIVFSRAEKRLRQARFGFDVPIVRFSRLAN